MPTISNTYAVLYIAHAIIDITLYYIHVYLPVYCTDRFKLEVSRWSSGEREEAAGRRRSVSGQKGLAKKKRSSGTAATWGELIWSKHKT